MALKLVRRLPGLGQFGLQRYPPVTSVCAFNRPLSSSGGGAGQPVCAACLCTAAGRCVRKHGCRQLTPRCEVRRLTTSVREPLFLSASSVRLHGDSAPPIRLTQPHGPTAEEEAAFLKRLESCSTSRHVCRLLCTMKVLSDAMAAAALHRVADLERDGDSLKTPAVLQSNALRTLCFELEHGSARLTDAALVSALQACTRLLLDPWSTLMVRLVSESQVRLDQGHMSLELLCALGQAMLSVEGAGSEILKQVMEEIQKQEPAQWSPSDLCAVYQLLQGLTGATGQYKDLLSAMHAHAMTVSSELGPSGVSVVLHALVVLRQMQVLPLVMCLGKQAVLHVRHFTDEELTRVLGALIHFGHCEHRFVEALEEHVPSIVFTSDAETVTKVMQFLSRRNTLSPAVMNAVAESFVYRADDYTTSQVARQIMAFGKLGYVPPNADSLFAKVEKILHTRMSQFQPRTLLNLFHSCILVERFPINFAHKVMNHLFIRQLQEQSGGTDKYIQAQLTQFYLAMKLECPPFQDYKLHPQYKVKSFMMSERSLETPVDKTLCSSVVKGLIALLGARIYLQCKVLTPYCYTLDVEIKLDEHGYVLPVRQFDDVHKRIAVCIDGRQRFTKNKRQLLGKEATKQRHLKLVGYEVVQIPYYEFENLDDINKVVDYLHRKIFPHSYRMDWQ